MTRVIRRGLLAVAVLTVGITWWVMSSGPDTPAEWADEYGGLASQYEVLLTSTDCAFLADTAEKMDAAYNRERNITSLGYQTASVDRMVDLNC